VRATAPDSQKRHNGAGRRLSLFGEMCL